jgi:hypothetical protein
VPGVLSKSSTATFSLGPVGMSAQDAGTLLIAALLNNEGTRSAADVELESITLESAATLAPTTFPVSLGQIDPGQSATIQATFNSSQLVEGQQYVLAVNGSYRLTTSHERCGDRQTIARIDSKICPAKAARPALVTKRACCLGPDGKTRCKSFPHCPSKDGSHEFTASIVIMLPPAAPGSASVQTTTMGSQSVAGAPFPPQPPDFGDQDNGSRWTVPTGPFVPATPTQSGTSTQEAPIGDPGGVDFIANAGLGISGSTTAEPSGATGGGVIFVSANWFAAYSTDGGSTFTQLNPTAIFPNDTVGFCCDQIVQYVPSIDRFIWLLQGNGVRLASASPADIISSNGTAWTYWNLTPDVFGEPSGTGFDYPDLSVGTSYLYMSWDAGWPGCPPGCNSGREVARTPLSQLQAGGTIGIDYTKPSDSPMGWGGHLSQDTQDEIFWAGHNSNSNIRVFSLAEGSNTYFWRDIGISSWANNHLSSNTPDGQDWLSKLTGFPGNAVIGATRSSNQLWLAWSAGTDNNFQQPHVEMVTLDRSNNFSVIQQVQIWNGSYAFAYPALATNACTGEIGLSLEYGGNGNYENHVVGFWGDFVVYITTATNVGTSRYGDYVTIRQEPPTDANPGNLFSAFGYGLNSVPPPGNGTRTDIRYVLFGRPASSCNIIP